MNARHLVLVLLVGFATVEAAAQTKQPQPSPQQARLRDVAVTSPGDTYMITMHTSVSAEGYGNFRDELYTVIHGAETLKVRYSESQTSSAKPGDSPGSGLHLHSSYSNPDLSQVPSAGVPIRACLFDKNRDKDGDLVIAVQPTPEPCMARIGNVLHYEPSPNGPALFTYVTLEILSETTTTPSAATRVQSPQLRKDIPTIAKAANGAIVTIVMATNDKPIAQGTGFVVTSDGLIVTNYHVIETGNRAVVKFSDGTILPVDGVLAADKVRDLAVVKIHGRSFRTLTLGNSDQIQVGEEVVAIGNPLGLELTVSNGILSGVRTDKEAGGKFLQTTAPITHGSSGGPLFNMMGEVVGITTLGFEGAGNLNFAIPVNDAKLLLSTRSAKLQNLPNESEPNEPEPKEAPTTVSGSHEDPASQQMCDKRAEKVVGYEREGYDRLRYPPKIGYTDHYDAGSTRCYVEIEIDFGPKNSDSIYEGRSYSIYDASFEGDSSPRYGSLSVSANSIGCKIRPRGFGDGITCRSEEEFNDLGLKYFGITQPAITTSPSGPNPTTITPTLPVRESRSVDNNFFTATFNGAVSVQEHNTDTLYRSSTDYMVQMVQIYKYNYNIRTDGKAARRALGALTKDDKLIAEKDTDTSTFDCRTSIYNKFKSSDDTSSIYIRYIFANPRLILKVAQVTPAGADNDLEWNTFLATLRIKDSFGCAGKAK